MHGWGPKKKKVVFTKYIWTILFNYSNQKPFFFFSVPLARGSSQARERTCDPSHGNDNAGSLTRAPPGNSPKVLKKKKNRISIWLSSHFWPFLLEILIMRSAHSHKVIQRIYFSSHSNWNLIIWLLRKQKYISKNSGNGIFSNIQFLFQYKY